MKLGLIQTHQTESITSSFGQPATAGGSDSYAVNDEPQPQLPVAFGFLKVNPEPITFVT